MDADLKVKWVEALRSGKYQQAQQALLNKGAYCCLGVLCDVMGAEWKPGDGDQFAILNGDIQQYYLEGATLETIGMTEAEQERLYHMNDDGEPFTEIANYIEAKL